MLRRMTRDLKGRRQMKRISIALLVLVCILFCAGCEEETVPISEYENLEYRYNNVQAQFDLLTREHEELKKEYADLEEEYTQFMDAQRIPTTVIRSADGETVTYRFASYELVYTGSEATQNKVMVHFTFTSHAEEPVTLSDVITLEVTQDGKNISMWASGASGSWKEIGKDETIEGYFYGKPLSETPIEIRIYRLIDDMYDDGDLLSSDRIEVIHVEEEPAEETGDIGDGTEP